MINTYTAFDFETSFGHIPCSLGIVKFKAGKPCDKFYTLIKPIDLKFNKINSLINGIKLSDVLDKPEFPEIWNEIEHFFTDTVIVAHNASFDISVLRKTLNHYQLKLPEHKIYCTLELSRIFFQLPDYKIQTVSKHLELPKFNHHNALDDALTCGNIFSHIINNNDVSDLSKRTSLIRNVEKRVVNNRNTIIPHLSNSLQSIFKQNNVAVTGTFININNHDLNSLITMNGGNVTHNVDNTTNILLAGSNSHPDLFAEAYKLGIPIMYESDIVENCTPQTEQSTRHNSKNLKDPQLPYKKHNKTNSLVGLVFVITGVFTKFSRDEAKDIIEDNGGKASGSVSSKTHFLLAGEGMGPAKLQKAVDLDVKIISEDDLLQMLNNQTGNKTGNSEQPINNSHSQGSLF